MKKLTERELDDLTDVFQALTIAENCLESPKSGDNVLVAKVQVRSARHRLDDVLKRIQE